MAQDTNTDTRQKLVEAAGKLFAQHGYEVVSTRMIADQAGVNLGGIHYHFGGKLNLYVEAFRVALETETHPTIQEIIHKHPHWRETPEGQAEIIKQKVFMTFERTLNEEIPWKTELMIQEICHASPARGLLVEKVFKPTTIDLIEFCHEIRPEMSDFENFMIGHLSGSQIIFYLLTKRGVGDMLEEREFLSKEFFQKVARFTATMIILYLRLPIPATLINETVTT